MPARRLATPGAVGSSWSTTARSWATAASWSGCTKIVRISDAINWRC